MALKNVLYNLNAFNNIGKIKYKKIEYGRQIPNNKTYSEVKITRNFIYKLLYTIDFKIVFYL